MKKLLIGASAFLLPAMAFAQGNTTGGVAANVKAAVQNLTDAVNAVVPFFLAIAVVVFIYGVIKYVITPDAEGKKGARGYIIWGIVGIALILVVLGLAKLLVNTLGVPTGSGGVTGTDLPDVPTVNN